MTTTPVIRTEALTKRYGPQIGLDGLDLEVRPGEILGFLGPNGAGKTTTIRLLLDLIRPTSGSIEVLGQDPREGGPQLRRRLGYLPGELMLEGRHDARSLLSWLTDLHGGAGAERIEPLAERLGLDLGRRVRGLSKGNKQKVGIVQAFAHRPDLLILDEPSSGLDPLVQQEFLGMLREARAGGATVLMSSHVLGEVEDIADRIAIIRAGKLVEVADVAALRAATSRRLAVVFADRVDPAEFARLPGLTDVEVTDVADTDRIAASRLTCLVEGEPDAVVKAAAAHRVLDLRSEPLDLEDLFLRRYRDDSGVRVADPQEVA